jgi:hypothetical protein
VLDDNEIASASPRTSEDDLLDAAIEGRGSIDAILSLRDTGRLTDAAREAVEELQAAAATLADTSPAPENSGSRLLDQLRAHMQSDKGEIDSKVVARLLGKEKPADHGHFSTGDVLAASDEDPDPPADS